MEFCPSYASIDSILKPLACSIITRAKIVVVQYRIGLHCVNEWSGTLAQDGLGDSMTVFMKEW